jgi:hypothetical protein
MKTLLSVYGEKYLVLSRMLMVYNYGKMN